MPKGGTRIGAGRPPQEQSRAKDRARRKAERESQQPTTMQVVHDGDWDTLPREGRRGAAPAWPLSKPTKPTPTSRRELVLWRRLWKTPQAVGWEKVGVDHDQVALYVRYLVEAEQPDATGTVRNLVRQYADGLGMTAGGLRMLRWKIGQPARHGTQTALATDAPAEPEVQRPAPGRSARERFGGLAVIHGDG